MLILMLCLLLLLLLLVVLLLNSLTHSNPYYYSLSFWYVCLAFSFFFNLASQTREIGKRKLNQYAPPKTFGGLIWPPQLSSLEPKFGHEIALGILNFVLWNDVDWMRRTNSVIFIKDLFAFYIR